MFRIGRKSKRKKKRFKIFDKISKHRNSHSRKNKLKKQIKRDKKSKHLETIDEKTVKANDKNYNDVNLVANNNVAHNKDDIKSKVNSNISTNKNKIKSKYKENKEYVNRVRSQVKEVLQENYDESFDKLFYNFENSGFVNRDNFLFRLIFMILKKYSFIDIFDENGEIDPNAIDEILKSVINDAYKSMNSDGASDDFDFDNFKENKNDNDEKINNLDNNNNIIKNSNENCDSNDADNFKEFSNSNEDSNENEDLLNNKPVKEVEYNKNKKEPTCNKYNEDCYHENFYDDE